MSENSKIEWTDHTFNPWEGCTKVGPGCDHCYAETRNARYAGGESINWGAGVPRRRTSESNWRKPVKWNAEADAFFAENGRRQRVFCASLADVFDNEVDPEWRADLFKLIEQTPNLDWLLLTKRIGNVRDMVPLPWISQPFQHGPDAANIYPAGWPANVWLGASIVNQEEADRDIQKLLQVPAAVRFLSMEPLLGPVKLNACWLNAGCGFGNDSDPATSACLRCAHGDIGRNYSDNCAWPSHKLDWIIVGGESGPHARPMHPDWARSLRDQCAAAGVPYLFKQWGEWAPEPESCDGTTCNFMNHAWPDAAIVHHVGKKRAGRLLDGVTHDGYPATKA